MDNISSLDTIGPFSPPELNSDSLIFPKSVPSISNNSFWKGNAADFAIPTSANAIDDPFHDVPSLSSTPPYSPQNHTFHNSNSIAEQQLHHLQSTGVDDIITRVPCLSNSFAKLSSSEEVLVFLFLFWFQPLLVALGIASNLSVHA